MSGIVYVLTNEAMPGLVKIGKTTSDDPQVRMDQLYNTSVPVPFDCALAVRVDDPGSVESALHTAFGPQRINPKREFFKIDSEQAIVLLNIMGSEDVTPSVNETNSSLSDVERSASDTLRKRRPNLNFLEMGIPLDSVLHAVDGVEEVTVIDERKVRFRDQTMSLTEATKQYRELSYAVAPAQYWLYQGRSLRDIYNETYPLDGG